MTEEFHGLSVDLTNCLEKRNWELAEAKKVIAALIVSTIIADCDKRHPVRIGRNWLKNYNDRVHPPRFLDDK